MFVVGVIFLLIFIVALVATVFVPSDDKKMTLGVSGVTITLSAFCFVFASIAVIDAGKVGVQITLGTVNPAPLQPGIQLVSPLCNIVEMSSRTENYWMSSTPHEGQNKGDDSVPVRSSNGLLMPVDVSVPYRLISETAPWVYSNLGKDYVEKLIRPALATATRRAGSRFTAEELYSTKRDGFAELTRTLMDEELDKLLAENYEGKNPPKSVVVVSQVLIGHIGIPDMVKTAIESKLRADQEQQAMAFTIKKAEQEAHKKEIEAKGIQKFQEIVTQGISDKLLQWKGIEATEKLAESPNTKIVIIGGGRHGLPILMNDNSEVTFPVSK